MKLRVGPALAMMGKLRCLMMTKYANGPKWIVFQVADVHKALLSITRIADAGYECHLGARGGRVLDVHTGETIPIARTGNLYVMKAWVKNDSESATTMGFARQGGTRCRQGQAHGTSARMVETP